MVETDDEERAAVTIEVPTREYFPGFQWALPKCFAGSLGACRFEQGDILYDTKQAYEGTWGDALGHLRWSLQVKAPARAPIGKTEKDFDSLFADGWNQRVTLELTNHHEKSARVVETTQGRLYTLLWKGDVAVLDPEHAHPVLPTLAKGILKQLARAVAHFRGRVAVQDAHPIIFLMPNDDTNALLSQKHSSVERALRDAFDVQRVDATPYEASLHSDSGFVPSLSISCYSVGSKFLAPVESALKRALYAPARDKKTKREVFKISAHGHLQAL